LLTLRSSLKDLTKGINTLFSSADSSSPLPDDLVTIIHAYLDKHSIPDESDSQRLQEELINIYQASVLDHHAHLAPFLAILSTIKPAIRGSGRLLQWWDKLSILVLSNLGQQKGLVVEARNALLGTLVYEEDDGDLDDAKTTSNVMAERLLTLWLEKSKTAAEEFDVHSRFVEGQINQILLAYGKKRPRDFLALIDTFFRKKPYRIPTLSLLGEFVRQGPPHLDQVWKSNGTTEFVLNCVADS
jgi:solute carrier family 25 protein 16